MSGFTGRYGSGPLHLLGMLLAFTVAGYAALQVLDGDAALLVAVWFGGAIALHDLVLYPLYTLADRGLRTLTRARAGSAATPGPPVLNYLRVPLLLSALLFVVFWPSITRHSEATFRAASGLTQQPFLGRWLMVSALLCAGSAVLYAMAVHARRRGQARARA